MRKYTNNNKTEIVSARVPIHIFNKINEIANETGTSRSEIICSILTNRFDTNDLNINNFESQL